MSKWLEIRAEHYEDGKLFIDAWQTDDDTEEGSVIAKIDINTKEIVYLDKDAKIDEYAQEIISSSLIDLCR